MKTILLGPRGQLGTDVQAANLRRGKSLSLKPVDRTVVDLSDIGAASRFLHDQDFQCLINCSSYHKTDEVEANAQTAFTINTHLVQEIAQVCLKKNARLIHISTDYVFGGHPGHTPLLEDDSKAPINVYGASKSMGEDLALMTGASVWVLRVASLFGTAGASGKGGNFVETMLRVGKEKGVLRVVSDQVMSPTATKDIAESGTSASVLPITSSEFPTAAKRPGYSVLDNSKVCRALGLMRPWQDALDEYLVAKGHKTKA
jgi:dTDP-4-dehydrorhamnose reductase